jgi:hypothetical protein
MDDPPLSPPDDTALRITGVGFLRIGFPRDYGNVSVRVFCQGESSSRPRYTTSNDSNISILHRFSLTYLEHSFHCIVRPDSNGLWNFNDELIVFQ